MWLRSLLKSLKSRPSVTTFRYSPNRPNSSRLRVEALDDRCLPSFNPAVSYAAGANPAAVATGDFDGNGAIDLAVANSGATTVSVLLGNGDGTFQVAVAAATGSGSAPISVAVGDFNGDGAPDLATANAIDVSVLLGHGDGTFAPPASIPMLDGSGPQSVAVGDFNADGKLDLGVASNVYWPGWYYQGTYDIYWHPGFYSGVAHVLIGNGLGGFSDTGGTLLGIGFRESAAVADFNGDGKQDFATVNLNQGVDVLAGDGAGNLRWLGGNSLYPNGLPRSVAAGDVNGDGKTDLITANDYSGSVGVLLGNGLGWFVAAQAVALGDYPTSVAIADFNQDGKPDVAAANHTYPIVSVVLGRGDGTFMPAINSTVGSSQVGVAAADFNGDGWPDAASANSYPGDASVLVNDHAWPNPLTPAVSVNDVTITESNTGTVTATFSVTLSAAFGEPITVHFATADGSATAGSDYNATSGDITFAPGQTTKIITVGVRGDRLAEPNETFVVNLSSPTNATIADGQGIGTIVDDEPRISISDVTKKEGRRNQTTQFIFTVTLSVAYDQPVTMSFRTNNGTAKNGDNDYIAKTGTITFNPGETTKTITIVVYGDNKRESDKVFYLDLSGNSGNSLFTKNRGIGTILNDD